MSMQRQTWFEGWRLFGLLTLMLMALCAGIGGLHAFDASGIRMVIRFRPHLAAVLLPGLFRRGDRATKPGAWTRWQRRNRRYLGVTFAASHGLHAIAIAAFAASIPSVLQKQRASPRTSLAVSATASSSR